MRKRSSYKPKAVNLNPLAAMRPASKEKANRISLAFHTALQGIVAGRHPGEEEWRSLSGCVNTVETMTIGDSPKLIAAEVMPDVNAAIAGMVGAAKRFKAGQGMRVDGPGLQALRHVLDIYEQCLEGLTEREMSQAQAETQRRVNALLHARAPRKEVISL